MRRTSSIAGAAALAAAAVAGGSLFAPGDVVTRDDALFDPIALARSLCGPGEASPFASRRAYFLAGAAAYADATSEPDPSAPPPLIDGLGEERLPATTESADARAYFDQGVSLTFGFNHGDAIRAFQHAQTIDPSCAMCLWGEAFALGPNINAPRDPEVEAQALAAARAAAERAEGASAEEQALIAAIQTRYSDNPAADPAALDAAFADAMLAAAHAHPDSDAILALAAEAVMDTSPWNYWEEDATTPRGRMGEALAHLETVLARNPGHAPAIHLYIHMTEASTDPWRAEAGADRLWASEPGAGHLIHMPSHVYLRVGRFKDSIAANIEAVAADEAFFALAGEGSALYRYGYYPHNIHFVMASAQMSGDGATALDMVGKLDASIPMEMTAVAGLIHPVKAAPLFALAQFGEAETVIATPLADGAPPYIEAMWRYARGEAYARSGRIEEAR
ncbi:MAG: hypothetical protein MI723_17160, partial [Caulobacterales bacterium]|nr:hypothetical protein [Caulobacterales bacterium]